MLSLDMNEESLNEESARNTEFAATMLATALGKKARACVSDTMWRTTKRHALGRVKTQSDFMSYIMDVEECEQEVFQRQEHALQQFLRRRVFHTYEVEEYVLYGPLVRLTKASYRLYCRFLSTVRQQALKYDKWENGPAHTMMLHHSKKLLRIRSNALSRKQLVLQTYIYLRDNENKKIYHESFNTTLWAKLIEIKKRPTKSGGARTDASRTTRCNWCRSSDLHDTLNIKPYKSVCPFQETPLSKAKKMAGEVMKRLRADGNSKTAKEITEEVLQEHNQDG